MHGGKEDSYVGEVGNTTTNEKDLALWVHWCPEHEVEDSAGVVVGLSLGWGAGVLAVVGELGSETSGGNGVSVDDGSTATSNEGPDTAVTVQDGKLKGSTSLGIHLSNVSLLLGHLTAEWSWELHWWADIDSDLGALGWDIWKTKSGGGASDGPLGAALELGGLVKLGREIEEVNLSRGGVGVRNDNERVDLEVCELAVNVDGVETGDEVNENVVDTLWHLLQKGSSNLLVGWELGKVDRDEKLLSLLIDIADIDTTLVGEEDPVALLASMLATLEVTIAEL